MSEIRMRYNIAITGEYIVDTNDYDTDNPTDIAYYEKDWIQSDAIEFLELAFHEYPDPKVTNIIVSPIARKNK